MVEMPMAHDQRIDLARIDADNIDIVEQDRGAVSEIEHQGALFASLLAREEQRKSPFAVQIAPCIGTRRRRDADAPRLCRLGEEVEAAVNQYMYGELVDRRRLDWRSACKLNATEPTRHGSREGGRTLQEVAPSNGVGHVRLQFEQMLSGDGAGVQRPRAENPRAFQMVSTRPMVQQIGQPRRATRAAAPKPRDTTAKPSPGFRPM